LNIKNNNNNNHSNKYVKSKSKEKNNVKRKNDQKSFVSMEYLIEAIEQAEKIVYKTAQTHRESVKCLDNIKEYADLNFASQKTEINLYRESNILKANKELYMNKNLDNKNFNINNNYNNIKDKEVKNSIKKQQLNNFFKEKFSDHTNTNNIKNLNSNKIKNKETEEISSEKKKSLLSQNNNNSSSRNESTKTKAKNNNLAESHSKMPNSKANNNNNSNSNKLNKNANLFSEILQLEKIRKNSKATKDLLDNFNSKNKNLKEREKNSKNSSSKNKENKIENASTVNTADPGSSHLTAKDKLYMTRNEIILNNLLSKNSLSKEKALEQAKFNNKFNNKNNNFIFDIKIEVEKIKFDLQSEENCNFKNTINITNNTNYDLQSNKNCNKSFLKNADSNLTNNYNINSINDNNSVLKNKENKDESHLRNLSRNKLDFNCISSIAKATEEQTLLNSQANKAKETLQNLAFANKSFKLQGNSAKKHSATQPQKESELLMRKLNIHNIIHSKKVNSGNINTNFLNSGSVIGNFNSKQNSLIFFNKTNIDFSAKPKVKSHRVSPSCEIPQQKEKNINCNNYYMSIDNNENKLNLNSPNLILPNKIFLNNQSTKLNNNNNNKNDKNLKNKENLGLINKENNINNQHLVKSNLISIACKTENNSLPIGSVAKTNQQLDFLSGNSNYDKANNQIRKFKLNQSIIKSKQIFKEADKSTINAPSVIMNKNAKMIVKGPNAFGKEEIRLSSYRSKDKHSNYKGNFTLVNNFNTNNKNTAREVKKFNFIFSFSLRLNLHFFLLSVKIYKKKFFLKILNNFLI
jgi:hypothetical protein